jgi:hypothetical protein
MRLDVSCCQLAPRSVRDPQVDNHSRTGLVCGIRMGFDVVYDEMHWKNYVLLGIGIRLRIFSSRLWLKRAQPKMKKKK